MKKYTHRDQIVKDIDRANAKIKKLEAKAQEELDAEQLYVGVDVTERRKHAEAANAWLTKVEYQRKRRLKMLGEKLAEMDTMPLPGTSTPALEQIMKAHQYLYYVVCKPVWTDSEFDKFCSENKLNGNGGSDLESDYSPEIIRLAKSFTPPQTSPESPSSTASTPPTPPAG